MDQLLMRAVSAAVVTAGHNQVHAELAREIDKTQSVDPHYGEFMFYPFFTSNWTRVR